MRRTHFISAFLFVVASVVAGVLLYDPRGKLPPSKGFEIIEDFNIYNVFDAGIADLNDDGQVDRWTVNHSAAQWVQLSGEKRDKPETGNDIDITGLYQDPDLPSFESGLGQVPALRPIRIYMREAHFIVEAEGLAPGARVRGHFDIPWRTEYEVFGGAAVSKLDCDTSFNCHRLAFDVPDGGRVELLPVPAPSDGFPILITLQPETDLSQVQIGMGATEPKTHTLVYRSKDRHSLALAELDDETGNVLFVSRGGARGHLPDVHPDAQDELFEWTDDGFQNTIESYGIEKGGCPGRQAGWFDVNGDGRLDLYQVCGRSGFGAVNGAAQNRLYIQHDNGRFTEDGASYGLDFLGTGVFRFLPRLHANEPAALLWVTQGEISLFEKEGERFEQRWRVEAPTSGTEKVILTNTDLQESWNALVFSPRGNLLFQVSRETAPDLQDVQALGLPLASIDGAVADFNGDGFRDVLAWPQGIFVRDGDRFKATDLLDFTWVNGVLSARVVPFDNDQDGDLDLWVLVQSGAEVSRIVRAIYNRSPEFLQHWFERFYGRDRILPRYWRSVLYENKLDSGHLRVLRPDDFLSHANGFGESAVVTFRMSAEAEDLHSRYIFTGMDDPSRYSQTFPNIFLSLPEGAELIDIAPVASENRED